MRGERGRIRSCADLGGMMGCGIRGRREGNQHLRIKNRGIPLHHSNRLIKRRDRKRSPLLVRHHHGQIQQQVLRLQLRLEPVFDALLLARGDADVVVARRGEVTDDLRRGRRGWRVGYSPE